MKKVLVKVVVFFLVFVILGSCIQSVLRVKQEKTEDLLERIELYKKEADNNINNDVIFLGTSTTYAGISPMIMLKEYGITAMNFGTSRQNAMSVYYLFKELLEYNTPKVVVLDLSDLCENRRVNNENEHVYERSFYTINTPLIKSEFLVDIIKKGGVERASNFLFSIKKYHDTWKSISKQNFANETYDEYKRGALLNTDIVKCGEFDDMIYDNIEDSVAIDLSVSYFNKIVDICNSKDIDILVFASPLAEANNEDFEKAINRHLSQREAIIDFCKINDIEYIDYRTEESQENIKLDSKQDFYDPVHLNLYGSIKISKHLGNILQEKYLLPNHGSEDEYHSLDDQWNDFYNSYYDILKKCGY